MADPIYISGGQGTLTNPVKVGTDPQSGLDIYQQGNQYFQVYNSPDGQAAIPIANPFQPAATGGAGGGQPLSNIGTGQASGWGIADPSRNPPTGAPYGADVYRGGSYYTTYTPGPGGVPVATRYAVGQPGAGGTAGTAGGAGGAAGGAVGGAGTWGGAGGGAAGSAGTGGTQMANGSSGSPSPYLFVGGQPLSAAQTQQIMGLYSAYEAGDPSAGQALVQWVGGMGMTPSDLNTAVSNLRNQTGPNALQIGGSTDIGGAGQLQPEQVALQQMAQIDPRTEALRQQLAGSYGGALQGAQTGPTAGQLQSYLNLYQQIDPQGFAQRQALANSMSSYLDTAQQQAALGSQLDPSTQREVDQATRQAQAARGNVYGTPQLVQEAMTRGTAGLQLQQQRLQNLAGALGTQQGYLTSGLGMGDTALNLYQMQQNQLRANQAASLGYLASGQTPYQAGAGYLNTAEQRAAAAAQGGAAYSPQSPSALYTGAGTSSYPQYGLDMSQLAGNWYNNMNQASIGAYNAQTSRMAATASQGGMGGMGGGIGTALGGIVGSIIPGVGTAIGGALGGALGSAAGSAFSG